MVTPLHRLGLCELKQWGSSGYRDSNSVKFIFANLSDASYKSGNAAKQATLQRAGLTKEYTIVPQYSGVDTTVFFDHDCKKYIIVFRGTDDRNALGQRYSDLATDLYLAGGFITSTSRYKAAEALLQTIASKHGTANIILTGHSLGGRIAGGLSQTYGIPAITYNEGASPLDWSYNRSENKLTTHFTTNSLSNITLDPLSVASQLPGYSAGKHTIVSGSRSWSDIASRGPLYKPTGQDSTHGIGNFT